MRNLQRLGVLIRSGHRIDDGWIGSRERASNQISGVGVFDFTGSHLLRPSTGYADFVSYPPIVLSGSLQGCWYTKVETVKDNGAPSGVYLETGREVFVGSLNGGPVGVFTTTYKFESKWDPDVSTGRRSVALPAPHRGGQRHRRVRGRHWARRLQGRRDGRKLRLSGSHQDSVTCRSISWAMDATIEPWELRITPRAGCRGRRC